jgi:hypothetical protein
MFIKVDGTERNWSVSPACVQWFATWDAAGWNGDTGDPGFFTPYFSNLVGVDGVDDVAAATGPHPNDTGYVLNYDRACYFSETTPSASAEGAWNADLDDGFYLVASGAAWDDGNSLNGIYYPTPDSQWPPAASGRACEMTIED